MRAPENLGKGLAGICAERNHRAGARELRRPNASDGTNQGPSFSWCGIHVQSIWGCAHRGSRGGLPSRNPFSKGRTRIEALASVASPAAAASAGSRRRAGQRAGVEESSCCPDADHVDAHMQVGVSSSAAEMFGRARASTPCCQVPVSAGERLRRVSRGHNRRRARLSRSTNTPADGSFGDPTKPATNWLLGCHRGATACRSAHWPARAARRSGRPASWLVWSCVT